MENISSRNANQSCSLLQVKKEKEDNTRLLQFVRCSAAQKVAAKTAEPPSIARSSSSFKVAITAFPEGTESLSSSTDEQAARYAPNRFPLSQLIILRL